MGWIRRAWDDPCPWVYTHGCVMPPLRGSCGCFRFPWVPCTMCTSPTAVLCHRYAVLCYVTAMRFCIMSPLRGSVGVYYVIRGLRSAEGARFTHVYISSQPCGFAVPFGHIGNEDVTSESIQSQALRRRTAAGRRAVPTSTRSLAICCSAPCERRCRLRGI